MKILIRDGKVIAAATDEYIGPDEYIQIEDIVDPFNLEYYTLVDGELVYGEPVPAEVTMGQCRLSLFDLHGIRTDDQFYALVDVIPEDQRERALLQLRTRTTVRYDNELVQAICAAKGWNADELFFHANQQ